VVAASFEAKFLAASVETRVSHKQAVEKRSNLPHLNIPQLVFLFHFDPEHTQNLF
jgi:hypothetical protein